MLIESTSISVSGLAYALKVISLSPQMPLTFTCLSRGTLTIHNVGNLSLNNYNRYHNTLLCRCARLEKKTIDVVTFEVQTINVVA